MPLRINLGELSSGVLLSGGQATHYLSSKNPIPTGCQQLDTLIGGGLPRHEITYIQGESDSGKSTLCEESALNFLSTGGDLAVFFCPLGSHPLPGFEPRLQDPERFLVVPAPSIRAMFASMKALLEAASEDESLQMEYLVVIDDLSSFPTDDKPAYQEVMEGIQSIRGMLRKYLTLILVNQLRDISGGSVGAVAARRIFSQASCVLHTQAGASTQDGDGLDIKGLVMKSPQVHSIGERFNMSLRFNYGVSQ